MYIRKCVYLFMYMAAEEMRALEARHEVRISV